MSGNGPKYIKVYNAIKSDLLSEKYPAGTFLPPEGELMKLYEASKTTIRHAVSMLREDHLVDVRQGRGTEVLSSRNRAANYRRYENVQGIGTRFLIEGQLKMNKSEAIVDTVPAEIRVAQALKLPIGTRIFRIQRLQLVNDSAFAYMVNYVPKSIAPNLDKFREPIVLLYDYLRDKYHLNCTFAEETINAVPAGFMESQFLKVPAGQPLIMLKRIAHCEQGILEYSETTLRSDLLEIYVTMETDGGLLSRLENNGAEKT